MWCISAMWCISGRVGWISRWGEVWLRGTFRLMITDYYKLLQVWKYWKIWRRKIFSLCLLLTFALYSNGRVSPAGIFTTTKVLIFISTSSSVPYVLPLPQSKQNPSWLKGWKSRDWNKSAHKGFQINFQIARMRIAAAESESGAFGEEGSVQGGTC